MDNVEYTAGDNPTLIGRQLLVVLAGEGADATATALGDTIDDVQTIDDAVDLIVRASGEFTPDFVVAQFLGTVMLSQFRGSQLAIRVNRRDGTEAIFRAKQTSGWSTVTETDCLTAEVMDVAASTGRIKARPVSPGSFTSSRLTYRSGVAYRSGLPAAPADSSAKPAKASKSKAKPEPLDTFSDTAPPIVAVIEPIIQLEPDAEVFVAEEPRSRTTLEFTNGRQVDVDRTILIGRSPRAERSSASELPTLLPVDSPGQAISRTHLKISVEGQRVLLEDLNSTNGTDVIASEGESTHLLPGEQALLTDGMMVSLGDHVAFKVVTLP